MHWLVGIDEAGYGPNLGPLVQAAVAARMPDGCDCCWTLLKDGVRRASDADDGRIAIDDSKLIHGESNGLAKLEVGVLAAIGNAAVIPAAFHDLLNCVSATPWEAVIAGEAWYDAADAYPIASNADDLLAAGRRFADARRLVPDFEFRAVRCRVTPTPHFNALVDRHGSKAAPLADGVIALIRDELASLPVNEPVRFVVDKQGGRNFYAPMIQTAIPDGWVVAECEGAAESAYRIEGLGREVRLVFKPRAERDCLPVALASMLAKYLREAFMRQFNRYWLRHVPGIAPTAGYPNDAKRFYAEIRGAMTTLGLREDDVWRKR